MYNKSIEEKCVPIDITIPIDVLRKLDSIRGDVPRSRFLTRLVKNVIGKEEVKTK